MPRYNHKERIRDHYDRVSPYYHSLWGEHLHHGYWIRGDETKEQAQVQLIEHLAQTAGIAPGRRILDVGCGFGASSIYLARNYNAEATGITISPVQVEMANKAASTENVKPKLRQDLGSLPGHHQKKIVLGARRKNGPCVCGSSQGLPGHESRLRLRQFHLRPPRRPKTLNVANR